MRPRNEDAVEMDRGVGVLAIADGMGGHPSGNLASRQAIQEAFRYIRGVRPIHCALREAILLSHAALAEHGDNRGCTLTLASRFGDELYIGHVGDTRVYVDGRLITEDQGAGEILHQFVGGAFPPTVELYTVPVRRGSWILMTTDGVHDTLDVLDEMPPLIMKTRGNAEEIARLMCQKSIRSGSADNCSVLVAQVTR